MKKRQLTTAEVMENLNSAQRVRDRLIAATKFSGAEIKDPPTFDTPTWKAYLAARQEAENAYQKIQDTYKTLPMDERRAAHILAIRDDLIAQFGPQVVGQVVGKKEK